MPSVLHSRRTWLPLTETWLYAQVVNLPPDIASCVVCESRESLGSFDDVDIRCLGNGWRCWRDKGLRRLGLRRHLKFYRDCARQFGAQILHSHFGDAGWLDAPIAAELGLAHIVSFYGYDVGFLPRQDPRWLSRYRELFASATAILCEGPHMADRLAALGCPRHKLHVHHLGVDVAKIAFTAPDRSAPEPLRILVAGSFREKKGIPLALRATTQLGQERPVLVTVIGDASAEPRSQAEKRQILEAAAPLGSRVRILGYITQDAWLEEAARHDVFLAPSLVAADGDTEGGAPVAILEAMASGLVVVSTRHCDIPELVEDGVSGLLAPERDQHGLVERLRLLADEPTVGRALAVAARGRVEREFSAAIQGDRLGAFYRSCLENVRASRLLE